MANIDERFICTSDLDAFFNDIETGEPLAAGILTFYSDVNRSVEKPVYQLTGAPGNYTYEPLANPLILGIAGNPVDESGNNIVIYYYPFTGTPEDNTGVQELYYITVQNSGEVEQFTRQGWPQSAGNDEPEISDNEIDNYIPNGQFLAHNDIVSLTQPPVTQYIFNGETVNAQPIAQGGWNFVYTNGSTSTFNNSFTEIPTSGGWGINSFPRFIFNFNCTAFNPDTTTRDLRIQWPDVNKFSSGNPPGSIPFTLFFDARSNDENSYTFTLYRTYYFGTGGSPSAGIEVSISTFEVGPSETFLSQNISIPAFPDNQGTIGDNGDDYVALSIRGPASGWNVSFTDFLLAQGNQTFEAYPITTDDQMLSRGVAGWMPTPNPDGSDLYLPLVLTPQGMTFDDSQVGKVYGSFNDPEPTELLCDGSTYNANGYSPLGIPYSRLFNKWYLPSVRGTLFGGGDDWLNIYQSGAILKLVQNSLGTITASPVNGAVSPGFTIGDVDGNRGVAGATSVGYNARANATPIVNIYSTFFASTNGSASFTDVNTSMVFGNYCAPVNTQYKALVVPASAATLAAGMATPGKYFTFSSASINYYVWFHVNGETDPAPGGKTGIRVNLITGFSNVDVGQVISAALSSRQVDYITCIGSSGFVGGAYFNFYVGSVLNTVWYKKAGVGSQPVTAATNFIEVDVGSADSATVVAQATQAAINSAFFAVPDLQGMFLRGYDPDEEWDRLASRTSVNESVNALGSFEIDYFTNHAHVVTLDDTNTQVFDGAGGARLYRAAGGATTADLLDGASGNNRSSPWYITATVTSTYVGNLETRPVNTAVNWIVKY